MSHGHERKQKECLNCGTIVLGRFCQHCGQENVEPKETIGAMIAHFFNDITHFDGKFFASIKWLFRKPGFLSSEYMKGRRASYLHPVRLYVFTSALFFLLFFALRTNEHVSGPAAAATPKERQGFKKIVARMLEKDPNNKQFLELDSVLNIPGRPFFSREFYEMKDDDRAALGTFSSRKYRSLHEYDSVQAKLPAADKDGWLKRKWNRRSLEVTEKYGDTGNTMSSASEVFLHKMPIMLIVSLPIFALILKLVYIRRKQFWYTDHAIFSVHQYVITFILFAFAFILNKMDDWLHWDIFGILFFILIFILGPVYLFLAMRRFYQQRWWKTFFKFLLLNLLAGIVLVVLLASFFLFAVFQI